mmetsp:Transcript_13862/g.46244  ORF Transcript_13862/g.46244 Transcript_13862/m.46244 type:complete len:208 (-) Transcript_13862:325-948(-)
MVRARDISASFKRPRGLRGHHAHQARDRAARRLGHARSRFVCGGQGLGERLRRLQLGRGRLRRRFREVWQEAALRTRARRPADETSRLKRFRANLLHSQLGLRRLCDRRNRSLPRDSQASDRADQRCGLPGHQRRRVQMQVRRVGRRVRRGARRALRGHCVRRRGAQEWGVPLRRCRDAGRRAHVLPPHPLRPNLPRLYAPQGPAKR